MQPKTSKQSGKPLNEYIDKNDTLACKFPGLAIPNKIVGEVNDPIDDVMAELEAFAPLISNKYDYITLKKKKCLLIIVKLFIVALGTKSRNQ